MKCRFFTFCVLVNLFACFIFSQSLRITPQTMRGRNFPVLPERKKPNGKQKKILQPDQNDLAKYSQFLKQPKTGIFRLLPDPGCEANVNVLRADKECLEAIPESSFYSFREKEHTSKQLSDIRLKNDQLISDGTLTQGFLVMLGDVKLEEVSLETDGLDFMQNFSAKPESVEARKQFLQFVNGVESENFLYRKIFPVTEDKTYALRVVAFRGSLYQTFRGFRYDLLGGDNRIDIIVAFRVIRKNADGSLTLLWKELERREAPKFKFAKKAKKGKS